MLMRVEKVDAQIQPYHCNVINPFPCLLYYYRESFVIKFLFENLRIRESSK